MWDTQSYVPVDICKIAGSIHLIQTRQRLMPECVKFKRNWIWNVFEVDWNTVRVTLNGNEINLPTYVTIPFRDKFGVRRLISKQPLLLHVILKQERHGLP